MSHTVVVFDASNACHRISAATQPLTTTSGERVEVVFGMLRLISSVLRSYPGDKCYLTWDALGAKKIRQKLYPDYKAHRETAKDEETKLRLNEMHRQVAVFWEMFGQHLPVTWAESTKYEADDIIAMISHQTASADGKVVIISGDKDLLQLVNEQVQVYSPNSNKVCSLKNFQDYTKGWPGPWEFLLGKVLQGDASDNIKGIPGVGEKTALKLLEEHDWDIHKLLSYPTDRFAKSAVGQKFFSGTPQATVKLNFKLMSLGGPAHTETDAWNAHVHLKEGELNNKALKHGFTKLQFASLLASYSQFIGPFIRLTV